MNIDKGITRLRVMVAILGALVSSTSCTAATPITTASHSSDSTAEKSAHEVVLRSPETYANAIVDSGPIGPVPPDRSVADIQKSNVTTVQDSSQIGSWVLREMLDDGKKLVIGYAAGSCSTETDLVLVQTSTEVVPIPFASPRNDDCSNNLMTQPHWGILTLDAPLGNRKLLHIQSQTERVSQAVLRQ